MIKGERERKIRSVAKAISNRVIGILNTFLIAWLITRNLNLSLQVMAVRETIAIILYFLHERFWNKVQWGKFRLEKLGLKKVNDSNDGVVS